VTKNFTYYLPTNVVAGAGQIQALPDILSGFGNRVLAIMPGDLPGMAAPIMASLDKAGLEVTTENLGAGEPTITYIDRLAAMHKGTPFDVILGIGGGSAMDVAKALSIGLVHDQGIWMYANLSDRPALPLTATPLPVVCVPTTAGTGSEVTPYAVLGKEDTKQKGTIQEPAIFPKFAILDPELLTSVPAALTASTGLDAFAHALEASINISKHAPAAETFGLSAMKKINKWLPVAVREPDNMKARMKLSWASTLAGMAISHRGTTTAHAIAEPLGAITKIPHGLGVSLATLPVLRATVVAGAGDSLAELHSRVFGVENGSAEGFIASLEGLFAAVDMTKPAAAYLDGYDLDALPDELIASIMRFKFRPLAQHPVEFDADSLKPIVKQMIFG